MSKDSEDVTVPETEPKFYLSRENEIFGPHSGEEIQELLNSNVIGPESLLWTEGMEEWLPLEQLSVQAPEDKSPAGGSETGSIDAPEVTEVGDEGSAEGPEPDRPLEEDSPAEAVATTPDPATADIPRRFRVADTFTPEGGVATPYDDRLGKRLASGLGFAVVAHLLLLAFLIWQAPKLFHILSYPSAVQPPEAPPLEVAMVSQDDSAPPPETPRPIAEAPPPPVAPPPPPAVPEVPLDTPPPTSQPSTFSPPTLPQPMSESPSLPTPSLAPPRPEKPRPRSRAPTQTSAPSVPTLANAGPSDYLDAPSPPYPRMARQQHQEGTVILLVKINDAGDPIDVQIKRSSGHTLLDSSARDWVAQNFRFKPGNLRLLLVPVSYDLRGG